MRTEVFPEERFNVLREIEGSHFWFAGRRLLIRGLLRRASSARFEILADIGCGPGRNLSEWSAFAIHVVGLDRHKARVDTEEGRVSSVVADALAMPLDDESVEAALALDVLEHTDDSAALNEIFRILRPGGVLLASVPAHSWLWSVRDEDAGHLRRYSKQLLRQRIEAAGLIVQETRYYQFFLLPLVLLSRWLGRRSGSMRDREDRPSRWVNALLFVINRAEAWASLHWFSPPTGSSLVVLARKP